MGVFGIFLFSTGKYTYQLIDPPHLAFIDVHRTSREAGETSSSSRDWDHGQGRRSFAVDWFLLQLLRQPILYRLPREEQNG